MSCIDTVFWMLQSQVLRQDILQERLQDSSSNTAPLMSTLTSTWCHTCDSFSQAFPLCFLHTASDQKLEVGKAWVRGNENRCVRAEMQQGPRGTGPTSRRSTSEEDGVRVKMEQEQSKCDLLESKNGNKGTQHQKRVRQKRKSLRKKRCIQEGV